MHSGASDHQYQGCAILIKKSLAEVTALRWAPVIAGHILHVRFPLHGKHVDVVCVYQFSWSYAGDAEPLRTKRERIWTRLDRLLSSLPRRNILIMGGDMNTSAKPYSSSFGPSTRRSRCPQPHQQLFLNFIDTHSLQAVNTWSRAAHLATFQQDEHNIQIDFLFGRKPG